MNLDWKKLGIIAVFIGAVALFAFFVYYFFFRPLVTPAPTAVNANLPAGQLPPTVNINGRLYTINTNGGLTPANVNEAVAPPIAEAEPSPTAQGGLTQAQRLIDTPGFFTTLGPDGQIIYYNPQDGKFYQISADGVIRVLDNKVFNNVANATWSQNRNKAILEYPDGSNIIYDFKTGKQTTLPKHWYNFSFSPTDQQIAFKSDALDPENRFLAAANVDGSQPVILENLSDQSDRFNVNWSPNKQMVATYTQGKDLDRSEVYFIGLNNENFKYMLVEGRDFRGTWSPTGDRMVYSVYSANNDYKPQLWIADSLPDTVGDNRRRLGLETWANKCSFAGNNKIYCAVPTELPFGAGLSDASATDIADKIYEIDLNTGAKTLVATPVGNHTIDKIIISESSNSLLFTDLNDNRIYRINL